MREYVLCKFLAPLFSLLFLAFTAYSKPGIIVFQSDFGTKDGAVSEVKGVMYSVDRSLLISDLTNEITPYNIWEAAYRLYQTAPYWPQKTVFVSVVDPGVGTTRRSVVALSKNGYYFITPDNGTLTFIAQFFGIQELRTIDETQNRLKGSKLSYTFHGRDVYGYTAAKLASGAISFEQVGPVVKEPVVSLAYQNAAIKDNKLIGTIVALDPNYGNIWTNIDNELLQRYGMKNNQDYQVNIFYKGKKRYSALVAMHNTFGEATKESDLLYLNSLLNLSLATNQGSFAQKHHIAAGADWSISIEPATKN